jgi:predicted pyridoxine 5'-phosphate oxidase superfamily flavin-nucleotide-binding protein
MSVPRPSLPTVSRTPPPAGGRTGFHDGELLVQQRAGVADEAARLGGMVGEPRLSASIVAFIADHDLVFLTARDEHGTLWTSALDGPPGFCTVREGILRIRPTDAADLPGGLVPGSMVGVLLVDFARRRRLRVNGVVAGLEDGAVAVSVDQAYGNCPRYIHPREPGGGDDRSDGSARPQRQSTGLATEDIAQIRDADTMILGTAHPSHGVDTSHRGGAPGFVRVEDDGSLWWPDLPGNNLFNSLGNIAAQPEASLLFLDAPTGRRLQVTGRAALEWVPPDSEGDDGGTGRRVHLWPTQVAARWTQTRT